jgi:hypothetical protein
LSSLLHQNTFAGCGGAAQALTNNKKTEEGWLPQQRQREHWRGGGILNCLVE